MKKYFIYLVAMILGCATFIHAADIEKRDDQCSKETVKSFFPRSVVASVLTENGIPQDKVDLIVAQLTEQSGNVFKIVEEKAGKMDPNPLKDFTQHKKVAQLFRETVRDIFAQTLNAHGIDDQELIQKMAKKIQKKKKTLFAHYMEKMQSN